MIGAIIGAIGSIGSSIAGGVTASKQRREEQAELARQRQENRNRFNLMYNRDETQRADAQRALTRLREQIQENNRAAAGRQAVIGGTEESVAATAQANAKAMSDTTADIVARADANKDRIEEAYLNRDAEIAAQQNAAREQQAQAITDATTQAIGAAAQLGSVMDGGISGGTSEKPATYNRTERKMLNQGRQSATTREQQRAPIEKAMQGQVQATQKQFKSWASQTWPS